VSTLYFETDQGDRFREPGFSKQGRLEPQITIGLLTGQDKFRSWSPPSRQQGQDHAAGHRDGRGRPPFADVTVVADTGTIFEADQKAIEDAGLSFILG
jgi:hypothetical protein